MSDDRGMMQDKKKIKPHNEPAIEWWKRRLGFGNKQGEGALAKRRKKALDDQIKRGEGL